MASTSKSATSEPSARRPPGAVLDVMRNASNKVAVALAGDAPRVEGDHYRVTRLQPYFNPGPNATTAAPRVYLGGVNAGMCRLAGERADGFITHPTNSNPRYLDTICIPNLRDGAGRVGRDLGAGFELVCGTPVVTGATRADVDAERERQRRLFAFLYSTPAYRRTLELYGWEDLAGRLQAMIRADRWDSLHTVVTDDILATLVPTATFDDLPALLTARFGARCDAVLVSPPPDPAHDTAFAQVVGALRGAPP